MSDYEYEPDGKIHTRYSELVQCRPNGMGKVLAHRANPNLRFSNGATEFGTDRHAMWEEESRQTGRIPKCFDETWEVTQVEAEFASEMLPGIVVHSRLDALLEHMGTIVDYKTIVADTFAQGRRNATMQYRHSKQLLFYAYQLGLHGIRITRGVYLIEIWNRDYSEILGYHKITIPMSMPKIAAILPWAQERMALLASAIESEELISA